MMVHHGVHGVHDAWCMMVCMMHGAWCIAHEKPAVESTAG